MTPLTESRTEVTASPAPPAPATPPSPATTRRQQVLGAIFLVLLVLPSAACVVLTVVVLEEVQALRTELAARPKASPTDQLADQLAGRLLKLGQPGGKKAPPRGDGEPRPAPRPPLAFDSVAVLPFDLDLGGLAEFKDIKDKKAAADDIRREVDRMAPALCVLLQRVQGPRVALAEKMAQGGQENLASVGKKLGTQAILATSVRGSYSSSAKALFLRLRLRLVEVETGLMLWADELPLAVYEHNSENWKEKTAKETADLANSLKVRSEGRR